MTLTFRPFRPTDLTALHAINVAGEPGVGAVTANALGKIISMGSCLVASDQQDASLGFLLTLGPGADYASKNYQCIDERFEDFIYVDRIAIDNQARGQSIGTGLYTHAFTTFAGKALLIGCEVNSLPPNPGSMRFHSRLGFAEVGTQEFNPNYAVTYLARRLS